MNFLSRFVNSKSLRTWGILFFCVIVLAVPLSARAAWSDVFDCLTNPIDCILQTVAFAVAAFMGVFVALAAWLLLLALNFSSTVLQAPAVLQGFNISLSLANLGFLLGLIVIAIATILRFQSYGMKQLLAKLIIMAVVINFGLVIAGAILNFSDQLAAYFISEINPTTSNVGTVNNSYFVTQLVSGFGPQQFWRKEGKDKISVDWINELQGQNVGSGGLANVFLSGVDGVITNFLNVLFIIVFLFIIFIVLLMLACMFMIRFVFLGYLIIMMPLAWFSYVFPAFRGNFTKWWSSFFRWAFFAPITVFFLYLALLSVASRSTGYLQGNIDAVVGAGPDVTVGIGTGQGPNFMVAIGEMILMVALSLGGLFMANSMSIMGAVAAVAAVKGAGKWARGAVGRGAGRAASAPLRTERGREFTQRMQQSRLAPVRWMGRGLEEARVATGERLVKRAGKRFERMEDDQLANAIRTLSAPDRIAALQRLQKNDHLNMVPAADLDRYLNQRDFTAYSDEKTRKAMRAESGLTTLEILRQTDKTPEEIQNELAAHFKGAPNPGQFAKILFDNNTKNQTTFMSELVNKGKAPLGITDYQEFQRAQQSVARAAAQGFSGSNLGGFFKQLTRGDQLDMFSDAARRANIQYSDLSRGAQRYFRSNGARDLGIGFEDLGIRDEGGERRSGRSREQEGGGAATGAAEGPARGGGFE